MKKRVSVFLNFVAFNLLFFALYLNFIHKDVVESPGMQQQVYSSVEGSLSNKSYNAARAQQTVPMAGEAVTVSKKEKNF